MQARRQSSTWFDLLTFLSLAAALGLAAGVALGALALLLATPAYGAGNVPEEGALLLRAGEQADPSFRLSTTQARNGSKACTFSPCPKARRSTARA